MGKDHFVSRALCVVIKVGKVVHQPIVSTIDDLFVGLGSFLEIPKAGAFRSTHICLAQHGISGPFVGSAHIIGLRSFCGTGEVVQNELPYFFFTLS